MCFTAFFSLSPLKVFSLEVAQLSVYFVLPMLYIVLKHGCVYQCVQAQFNIEPKPCRRGHKIIEMVL